MKKTFLAAIILIFFPALLAGQMPDDSLGFKAPREKMVSSQIRRRGISDKKVLTAMTEVPRHRFVPENLVSQAYADHPLPIGQGQTISQPYIVALMTESLGLKGYEQTLEIGTGSGYQAAILANITKEVYTIEIKEQLYKTASQTLRSMGYTDVKTRHGDGYFGWPDSAPFDCIMITAAIDHIPPSLLKQLKDGGRLILPLGNPFSYQNLSLVTKHGADYTVRQITGVLFVPMTGYALDHN
ncbi:MAG: protein-L-isoaspartate(D-aspartate) O-methyltransferase [Desulfobacteraceae bacterium]|nr:protein-L-isoaspartate(D-aspartate) O-methyltransferase [Desulfobacteraceae bacterium]MDH3567194.1 protein-L-isoaspartate(D-aspartate) O-methyltransferase [Desulfobacteraceae bacterium]